MARNWTIFGPNRPRRRELNFEKFSNERASEQTNQTNKKIPKIFRKIFKKFSKNLVIINFEIAQRSSAQNVVAFRINPFKGLVGLMLA